MSTVKKLQATAAWECRNCDHVTSGSSWAGSMPLALRICQMVDESAEFGSGGRSPWWTLRLGPRVTCG